jgi:hypothetical protein
MQAENVNWQPVIDWLAGVAEAGEDFVAREAPALAEEVVRWGIVDGVVRASVSIAVLAIAGIVYWRVVGWCQRGIVRARSEYHERKSKPHGSVFDYAQTGVYDTSLMVGGVLLGMLAIFCVIAAITGSHQALKAYTAPRLYLVEQVGELLGK